tara:strand:- start:1100 stop:1486 length:387 start_codon:yes stop_codon:yes gene_type:complete
MGFSYLQSKVITIATASISNGARVALAGLPDHMHWFGCNFFWPGVNSSTAIADVSFYDGPTSSSRLIIFDCRGNSLQASAAWATGSFSLMLEEDAYIQLSDGLEVEFTFSAGTGVGSQGDAVMTVFYQ